MVDRCDRKDGAVLRQTAVAIAIAAASVAPACATELWVIGGVPVAGVAGHTPVMPFPPGILANALPA